MTSSPQVVLDREREWDQPLTTAAFRAALEDSGRRAVLSNYKGLSILSSSKGYTPDISPMVVVLSFGDARANATMHPIVANEFFPVGPLRRGWTLATHTLLGDFIDVMRAERRVDAGKREKLDEVPLNSLRFEDYSPEKRMAVYTVSGSSQPAKAARERAQRLGLARADSVEDLLADAQALVIQAAALNQSTRTQYVELSVRLRDLRARHREIMDKLERIESDLELAAVAIDETT